MTPRRSPFRSFGYLCVLTTAALTATGACSSDDDAPAPPPAVSVTIEEFASSPLPICDRQVPVMVRVEVEGDDSFAFRGPGACASLRPCGYAEVELRDESGARLARRNAASATSLIRVPDSVSLDRVAEIAVRLLAEDGTPFEDADGNPAVAERALTVVEQSDCVAPGEGGAGGTPSSSGGAAGSGGDDSPGGESFGGGGQRG